MTRAADRPRWTLRRALGLLVIGVFTASIYAFLYAPLIVTALFSFNDSTVQTLPFEGFTLKWYQALFNDSKMLAAIVYSLEVALVAVLIASVAGFFFALIQVRTKPRGHKALDALLTSPMVTPGMVLGISLLVVIRAINMPTGFLSIVIGHAAFITPLVYFLVAQRLRVADPTLEQASMDCGAGPLRTFWHVTLPGARTALLAAALLGFTLSMDEIAVTFFLAGTQPTLPVYVWGLLRFGFTPEVNAAFSLIAGLSLSLLGLAGLVLWISARRHRVSLADVAEPDSSLWDFVSDTSYETDDYEELSTSSA